MVSNMKITSKSQLEKYIKDSIADVLLNEVTESIRKDELDAIDRYIYEDSTFSPKMYERRKKNDGLGDPNNIRGEVISNKNICRLEVGNYTLANPDIRYDGQFYMRSVNEGLYLTPIIIGGRGYEFDFKYRGVPRDFIEGTKENMYTFKSYLIAFKQGLERKGFSVE